MSTHVPPEVVPVIRDAVSRHPAGATIKDILAAFPEPPARRTLQRWLGNLVQAGELIPKAPDDPADPIRYLLPSAVASVGGQRSPDPVASVPDAGHGQRDPAVASDANERRGQRSETVASDHGQRPADVGHANAGHGLPATQAPATPSLPHDSQRSPDLVASAPDAGHGQRNPAVASVADETRGQRSADVGRADAGHAPQPKPHRRKPAGAAAGQTAAAAIDPTDPTAPAGSVGSIAADVVTDLVDRVLRPRPKSGSPVRKRHRRTLPLVISTAVAAALLAWHGHLTWNVWTLSATAVAAAIAGAIFLWKARPASASPAADPTGVAEAAGADGTGPIAVPGFGTIDRRTVFRIATVGSGVLALIAALLAYRQYRLRPTIGTVQSFVASRLASLPARVLALDVTFVAPGKAGVRLTYRAAVENTAPLYQTVATATYLQNQPGNPWAALISVDMTLDGVGGEKVRSAVGPAPTPDARKVILLEPAVPIGTTAVASGTLVAWRTDNGWKFTIEQEIPPRFAGEPRPTDKPSFVLDDPAEAAALADLLQRTLAYAAKVKEVESEKRNAVGDKQKALGERPKAEGFAADAGSGNRDTGSAIRDAGSGQTRSGGANLQPATPPLSPPATPTPTTNSPTTNSPVPNSPPLQRPGAAAKIPAFVPSPAQGHPGSVTPPPSSGATPAGGPSPRDALRQDFRFSALPTASGAYVFNGLWQPLPRSHREKVQSTPQALTMKLQALEYAEDTAAGRTPKPPTAPIANVILSGTDSIPTAPAGELVLVYVGELKLPSAAIMAKYPALKEYPEIELAPVQIAAGTTRYVPLYLVAPGALAFGPSRVPATLEHPAPNTVILRASNLAPGRYALACGPQYYEVSVR